MKTFLKIVLTLAILGALGYGGWWAYNRYFAEAPKEGTVYVQSVSAITGVGPAGRGSRYSGVVEAKNVIEIDPDKDLTVKECFVSAGDKVTEGAPLFSYDVASMEITHQQLILDIQGLENDIRTGNEKLEKLKNKLARARENQKLDIQTDVNAQELELRKKAYELANKQKDFEAIERFLENTVVCSPVTGKVRSVKSPEGSGTQEMGYGDGSQSNAYITIVAGNDYCVKGTVSEQTIHTLQEGMAVRITSRVDDGVWQGRIYKINTEEAKQSAGRYYYYDGGGEQASKYEFFVELDSSEGLLMGQHVYIEPGAADEPAGEGLLLPFYYVVDTDGAPFVYAADSENRIEKRPVTLGERDEERGTVTILEGLSFLDRIAFPDETVQVGMAASETAYVPDDMGMDMGELGGMDMGELGGMDLPDMPDMPDMDMPEANMPEEVPAEGAAG